LAFHVRTIQKTSQLDEEGALQSSVLLVQVQVKVLVREQALAQVSR
jgi:hypothetical protein